MESTLTINNQKYQLERYPKTKDNTLKAWSNAELLVLNNVISKDVKNIHLFNDRFGFWNCTLNDKKVTTIWNYASQQKAINHNKNLNELNSNIIYKTSLDNLEKVELALIKIPKSLELFELFLQQVHKASISSTEVVCGFMTKYFSPSFLKIASNYFEISEQSKAWKKARLLVLKQPKEDIEYKECSNKIGYKGKEFNQYYGVFSSGQIDIGTQFFLKHIKVLPSELKVLDLASGNGVIAHELIGKYPNIEATLIDDFNLAIASSKLNLKNKKATFICDNNLNNLEEGYFDLVVSNPPFHFEHENNIEVALELFKGVKRVLNGDGRFLLVANKHLNYKTHLTILFNNVTVMAENAKFIIYECVN
ncbi:class I SAM-dependent methyltransferase [Tenacibaculum sp. E3R01]|uniref:class I SAM-dependent methyltransferase n=1 Tax=Tenacibaculum sp. E3R01 TaxID=2267227 RepID=UPI000DE802B1|nr:methyltransferase [Tenacibaculum sp. E3R01]RBW61370.1 class I SAM-dependent methyltransferase [Tenacibaculum sp. E3R01]